MSDTLTIPNKAAPAAPAKPKTVRLKLKHDLWIDDGAGGTIRLETNVKRLDEKGNPIFNAAKGDFERDMVEHDVPLAVAKVLIAENKAIRTDPLPGE